MESFVFFTVFYIFFCTCFVFSPPEFSSLGLSVESLFSHYLNNESHWFIHYHIRRTVATLMTHSSIPLVYVLIASYMFPQWTFFSLPTLWRIFTALSLIPPSVCAFVIYSWHQHNWKRHPIALRLKKFVTQGSDINQIATDINNEYRSVDKVVIKSNTITKVVATENWLFKISMYDVLIAHQSDVSLELVSSNEYRYASGRAEGAQYLNINVKCNRPNVESFQMRINSLDFKDLQEKVIRPINIMDNIVVQQSQTDRFIVEFKKCVMENPKVLLYENVDVCIGCMQTVPNVKLFTSCGDLNGPQKCTMCYCRPLWCLDCMGKWFASRQDQDRPDTWLSAKCTCPMCRSTFCILDVCLIIVPDSEIERNDSS